MVSAPTLPALWHPALREFVDQHQALIRELAEGFGAPVHFMFPERFAANLEAFQRVLATHGVAGRVFYAKKANKARCFVRACAASNTGVDVASLGEFTDALAAGIRGADIGVSGPEKADELLRLSVMHGALIAIDNPDELARLAQMSRGQGHAARVLLRMQPAHPTNSRFGLSDDALDAALSVCASNPASLRLEGFSFHLSGYSAEARCAQAGRAIHLCVAARSRGLAPRTLNIGGGFAMAYVSERDWHAFLASHQPHDYHAHKSFDGFYPYYQAPSGVAMLEAILNGVPAGETRSLAELLNEHDLRLMLEPGRALLDQAGFTVFAVQGTKDCDDYGIVTANGTSFSVSEQWFGSEFLPDPELLAAKRDPQGVPYRACVGGASCLDTDMLTWRKVAFPQRPRTGDLLLYPNTAGYQMDSNESPFHELPLPPKIVVTLAGERPRWHIDRLSPISGA
jgi:diaminopimelate decarboxylase